MHNREECLRIALRVMSFFAHLNSKGPSKEELRVLDKCAELPGNERLTARDLARRVIDKALMDGSS